MNKFFQNTSKVIFTMALSMWWILAALLIVVQPFTARHVLQFSNPSVNTNEQLTESSEHIVQGIQPFTSSALLTEKAELTTLEKSHLIDVKRLLTFALVTWILLSGYLFMFAKMNPQQIEYKTRNTVLFHCLVLGLASIGTILFWEPFFIAFHYLFFPQGNWSFPVDSMLIQLYPETFWQMAGFLIGTISLVLAMGSWGAVRIFLKKKSSSLNE